MSALLKALSTLVLAIAVTATAHATVVTAASNGNALTAGVDILGVNLLSLDLLAQAQGATPPGSSYYDYNGVPLSVNVGVPLLLSADAGASLLYGEASYDGTTAQGSGGVENLGLGVDGLLGASILGLTLDTLNSTSSVSGDYGSWTASGSSTITNLMLNILGSTLNLSAYVNAAPNTQVDILGLLGLVGVHLTLNEQNQVCDVASCSMETNALHLWADPLNLNLVGTNIVLGHSYAELSAEPSQVPLPSSLALTLGGLGMLGVFARRRSQEQMAAG